MKMAASPEPLPNQLLRRSRYARATSVTAVSKEASNTPPLALTPTKLRLLGFLAECRLLSLPQLARLACPSQKSARRHLRDLFDAGLVDVIATSRVALAALAEPDTPNDETLLYGSAPNLYVPTRAGLNLLFAAGLIDKAVRDRPPPSYGPRNSLFLAHELAIRDVRVWLEQAAYVHGEPHRVECWEDGTEAVMDVSDMSGEQSAKRYRQVVRPDAWFVYRLRPAPKPLVLVGLVEADQGTERGLVRWSEKLVAYDALFASGRLHEITGYNQARVLVVTPTAPRRDGLAALIGAQTQEQSLDPALAGRFFIAERGPLMAQPDLCAPVWRRPGNVSLVPLVPADLLAAPLPPAP